MPYQIDFFPEQHLVRVRFEGDITVEEEFEAIRQPAGDPRWFPEPKILVDRRNATMNLAPEHVAPQQEGVKESFGALGRCRTAIVVGQDYDFAMARMFEIRSESKLDHDIGVFRSMDEAARWLDIDLDSLD